MMDDSEHQQSKHQTNDTNFYTPRKRKVSISARLRVMVALSLLLILALQQENVSVETGASTTTTTASTSASMTTTTAAKFEKKNEKGSKKNAKYYRRLICKARQAKGLPKPEFNYNTENHIPDKYDEELRYDPQRNTNHLYVNLFQKYRRLQEGGNDVSSAPLRLAHVWSPYVVGNDDSMFSPLNQAQNLTWESMHRAQQYVLQQQDSLKGTLEVEVFCAILWMDVEILQTIQPSLCQKHNTLILNRSSATEYPSIVPRIHYPFVQDMLNPLLLGHKWDYIVLTNSDITLVEPFYVLAALAIQKYGFEMYTVNRRTISKGRSTTGSAGTSAEQAEQQFPLPSKDEILLPWTSHDLEFLEREEIKRCKKHPGTDCYIVQTNLLKSVQLGNLFVGHPPWAKVLKLSMYKYMAKTYQTLTSDYGWTYHLGDDRGWDQGEDDDNELFLDIDEHSIDNDFSSSVGRCCFSSMSEKRGDDAFHHLIQNTQNCATLCANFPESIFEIYRQKLAEMKTSQQNDVDVNSTAASQPGNLLASKLHAPPFVVDKERFADGVLQRLYFRRCR